MMKSNTGFALLLAIATWFPAAAQTPVYPYNPTLQMLNPPPGALPTYKSLQADAIVGTAVNFILFGDGEFDRHIGNPYTFQHYYPTAATVKTYDSKAFFVQKYDPIDPTALTVPVTVDPGATAANPTVFMASAAAKIGSSWNPAPGRWFFTILSFRNGCPDAGASSGTLEYYYRHTQQTIDPTSFLLYNGTQINNNWFSTPVISTITPPPGTNYTRKMVVNFTGLPANVIRNLFVKTTVSSAVSPETILDAKLVMKAKGCPITEIPGTLAVKTHPHDPNGKSVDQAKVCSHNFDPHTLTYTITFQNDGDGPVQNVKVEDNLVQQLVAGTAQLINTNCDMNVVPPNNLKFEFVNLYLPGFNQPDFLYTYDQTVASVAFRVNTETCLLPGFAIPNHAMVDFLAGDPPMQTTTAITTIDQIPCDVACEEGGDDPGILSEARGSKVYDFEAMPNPVADILNLKFTPKADWQLQVLDAQGRRIFSQSGAQDDLQTQSIQVNVQDWPGGVYFLHWTDSDQHVMRSILKI